MPKLNLSNVTLCGTDTIDVNRLLKVFAVCESYADFGAKKLFTNTSKAFVTESGIEVFPSNVASLHDYNHFNLKQLNDYVATDFVMVVEHDGFILNPAAWSDEFLKYDYIGAPLAVDGELVVGNGGFSIRSKKLLELTQSDPHIQLGNKADHKYAENEDWVISIVLRDYLESKGITFAPVDLAKQFSLESNQLRNYGWDGQFGWHGLHWTDISKWTEANPQFGIENVFDMDPVEGHATK